MNQNESKPKKKNSLRGFFLILVLYLLFSGLPALKGIIKKETGSIPGNETEYYHDLVLIDMDAVDISENEEWKSGALQEAVPELKAVDLETENGRRLYRFDVTVMNKGTVESGYGHLIYVESDDDTVSQIYTDTIIDSDIMDTRMIPPGRRAVVTVYALVSPDASECTVKTYDTRDGESEATVILD